ncbi:MAG: lysophospholipid acyltransferase family protein [Bacteroidales bacterium]|nr:lysophospholipid acyltransferase family protein [Bacteroidales bacterium]
MNYLVYLIFRAFVVLFRFMPFRLLYGLADIIYYIVYYIVGYRKTVVLENLRNSFPEKSKSEINRIAKAFYHHFADMLIESLKAFTMSEAAIIRRYKFNNSDVPDFYYKKGLSVICVAGHYGNWEWAGIASGKQVLHRPIGFYKPLSNVYIDKYIQQTRVRGRSKLASIVKTIETFKTDWGEPAIFYMVADQSPSSARLAYWVNFLNQDTAVLHGPEKYARIYNLPVVFASVNRIKRGYYTVDFKLMEATSDQTKTGELTARFMQLLEDVIKANPEYYLWSHRRWKLKK